MSDSTPPPADSGSDGSTTPPPSDGGGGGGAPPPSAPPPSSTIVNIDITPLKDELQALRTLLLLSFLPEQKSAVGSLSELSANQILFNNNIRGIVNDHAEALGIDLNSLQVGLQGQLAQGQGKLTVDLQVLGALIGGGLGQLSKDAAAERELVQAVTRVLAFLGALVADRNTLPRNLGQINPASIELHKEGDRGNILEQIILDSGRQVGKENNALVGESLADWVRSILNALGAVFKPLMGSALNAAIAGIDTIRTPANAINEAFFGAIVAGTLRDIEKLDAGRPENVAGNSAKLLVDLMNRGLNASLLTKLPELFHPLKHLGFGQMAAFSADLAGFGPVAGAIHSPAVNAAVGTPQKYAMNARFTPNIPSEGDLEELLRKKLITGEDFLTLMSYHGYSARWSSLKLANVHKDLTLGDISRVIEDTDMGSDWILRMVQQRGLNDEDSALVADSLTQKITRSERGRVITAALESYQQGIGSREDLLFELESLGLRSEKVNLLVRAADLRAALDYAGDAQKMVLEQYRNDQITEGDLALSLSMIGYRPERVEIVVGVETTKKTAKIAKRESTAAEREIRRVQAASIPFYREQFLQGLLTAGEYRAVLIELGVEEPIAAATVGVDELKVSAREGKIKNAEVQREQRQILETAEQALIEHFRKDLITGAQLAGGLADLGIPARLVDAIVLRERAVKVPTPRRFVPPPPELLERTIAERTRQVILTRYGKGLIDRFSAFDHLLSTGEDRRLAEEDLALVDARTYRVPKPPKPTAEQLATRRAQRDEQLVRFRAGLIDAAGLGRELVRILYDQPLADALVALEEARAQAARLMAEKKAAEAAEKAAQRERERAAKAEEARRRKEEEEAQRAAEKAAREAEAERKRIEEEAQKLRRDALIKQYRAGLLDEQMLFEELYAIGIDLSLAAAIVEREAAAAAAAG